MKIRPIFLAVLMVIGAVLSAGADDTFPTLQVAGVTYRNVTVTAVTATDIYFTYDGGMGNAKLENLSPDLQQHFHYDPTRATAAEKHQARANAQYLASQPPQWGTDLPAALNWARSENKCVLMDFTGSDWCPWCIKLDQEVFSSPQFATFANAKLLLVRVDFPHNSPQSEDLRQANNALARRFDVDGYPTCILLDSSGRELGRMVGYPEGGADAFVGKFNDLVPAGVGATTASAATAAPTAGPSTTGSATPSPAATGPVSPLKKYWYWFPGGVLLLVMVRGIKNSLT